MTTQTDKFRTDNKIYEMNSRNDYGVQACNA